MNDLGDLLIGVVGFTAGIAFLGWAANRLGVVTDEGCCVRREPMDGDETVPVLQARVGGERGRRRADADVPAVWRDHERGTDGGRE